MKRHRPIFILLMLLLLGGCAAKATDYYPLTVGNTWTYEVVVEGGGVRRVTETIHRRQYEKYFFNDGEILLISSDRSLVNKNGTVILENIFRPGYQWIESDMRFEFTAIGKPVTVPAGVFDDTLEVTWTSMFPGHETITPQTRPTMQPGPNPRVFIYRTTYARGVGKIKEELTTIQPDGTKTVEFVSVLTYYKLRWKNRVRSGGAPPTAE